MYNKNWHKNPTFNLGRHQWTYKVNFHAALYKKHWMQPKKTYIQVRKRHQWTSKVILCFAIKKCIQEEKWPTFKLGLDNKEHVKLWFALQWTKDIGDKKKIYIFSGNAMLFNKKKLIHTWF